MNLSIISTTTTTNQQTGNKDQQSHLKVDAEIYKRDASVFLPVTPELFD